MNISPLTKDQWRKVGVAILFSFSSTFLSVIVAAGGIQDTLEATIALALSALVASVNAALYATYQLLFVEGK